MKNILIVEDDKILNQMVSFHLRKNDYQTLSAFTYKEAFNLISNQSFDLIILDINLSDGCGYDLCSTIKATTKSIVIFLTAKDLDIDIIHGYDLGADDYIVKPFSLEIFMKKIKVIMNRVKHEKADYIFTDGFLFLDFDAFTASLNNQPLTLTPLEFKTLKLLFDNSSQIITRQTFLEHLWDIDENFVDESSLNVIISRIRKKIETDLHKYIRTIYGIGYMWLGGK